ncbi:hypothetical protein [Clostridium sp. DJ247]|uniref:hypothetical protein n=1 Tax=Clostridium sp. DJ247 TaxID=2726188 RepID=UPI00162A5BD0|nr:hypothetical protein [Clostridium sp. DJ247]MBC2581133.1 hypothetical protein [Clostridium sp. DJ247]
MKATIVCYVGDYVIYKKENGDVCNVLKNDVVNFNIGDIIYIDSEGKIQDKDTEEKYYFCDDVIVFYKD